MILLAYGCHFGIIFDAFSGLISVSIFASIFGALWDPAGCQNGPSGRPFSLKKSTFRYTAERGKASWSRPCAERPPPSRPNTTPNQIFNHFGPIRVVFGSILDQFWSNFGVILASIFAFFPYIQIKGRRYREA